MVCGCRIPWQEWIVRDARSDLIPVYPIEDDFLFYGLVNFYPID